MPEHESLVGTYVHLAREQRANEALHMLKKVASLVKPIMRARGWKVGQLAEFYPAETNLLGLNVNQGMKICLRLRYPGDRNQFLPMDNVVDTMLHELAHIVHGPHNQHFHALWDQLRDECQGLMMKGYTGEGFLGQGRRLGGARMPDREIRRVAREAAEKRRGRSVLTTGSGQRLGGAAPAPGQDIRRTITAAVERRNAVLRGCGSERFNERQIHDMAETATRNGFKTQGEEDEANEAAIAQALWELVQEDEKARLGQSYVRPSAEQPQGRKTGTTGATGATGATGPTTPDASRTNKWAAAVERAGPKEEHATTATAASATVLQQDPTFWVCSACTLQNPLQYLCCDACGSERALPKRSRSRFAPDSSAATTTTTTTATATVDLTVETSPPRKRRPDEKDGKRQSSTSTPSSSHAPMPTSSSSSSSSSAQERLVWLCTFCGTAMERQWWTCSLCGKMKDDSR